MINIGQLTEKNLAEQLYIPQPYVYIHTEVT